MISDKICPHHLERKAILYVRQSSAHQVLHNRESGALQCAMRDRLTTLGWSEVEVIDDDLGRSAAGGVPRAGFERMVAQVCLGKVGAIAAREVSRFARNSRDWQQLDTSKNRSRVTPCRDSILSVDRGNGGVDVSATELFRYR
jgi:DNA invertase Pin-like site-specific DNA recombinase